MITVIDIDGVIIDFAGATLNIINDITGAQRTIDEITHCNIFHALGVDALIAKQVRDVWRAPGFARGLPVYPYAHELLTELRKLGPVVAATAPLVTEEGLAPHWINDRYGHLRDLGFAPHEIIFTHTKERISGDAIIEDNKNNAELWALENQESTTILIDRPWNRHGALVGSNCIRWCEPAATSLADFLGCMAGAS